MYNAERKVIEFFTTEGQRPIYMHEYLKKAYSNSNVKSLMLVWAEISHGRCLLHVELFWKLLAEKVELF